jgi:hypothetical protein
MRRHCGRLAALTIAAVVAMQCCGAQAAPCKAADLGWMQSIWRQADGDQRTEERWSAESGVLLGSSWFSRAGKVRVLEVMAIADTDDATELRMRHFSGDLGHAREEQDVPMVFALSGCDGTSAVFEGRGTQAGERITYRRSGDALDFLGEFIHQGKPVRAEVKFSRGGS